MYMCIYIYIYIYMTERGREREREREREKPEELLADYKPPGSEKRSRAANLRLPGFGSPDLDPEK